MFNTIPVNILTPGTFVEIDNSRAVRGVQASPHEALMAGQQLSTGSGTAGSVYNIESADEAKIVFGIGSQLAAMCAAYKSEDSLTPLWAVGVADDAGGTQAAGSIVWTGTATETGELPFYVGGRRIPVSVVKGDTAATVETSALAAFALVQDLPVTVAGDAASGVDFTFRHKGTIGNQCLINVCLLPGERVPAGLTVVVTAMASGATDPSYAGVITAMGEDQYHTVAVGLCTSTACGLFVTELESRWGPMRAIDGQAFACKLDTRANLTTLGNSFNSFALSVVGLEASALLPMPWEIAAATAAISAFQAQVDPSRAFTGLPYPGYSGAPRGTRFTRGQRDILLSDGISTALASADGRLRVERLVTTYQVNAASVPDTSYQDLTTVRLLSALRYSLRVRIGTKFARFKLASDDTVIPANQPIVTPKIIRAEVIALFQDWQDLGWVEGLEQFKDELFVVRDIDAGGSDPNRVNIILPPDLINNLLVTAAQIAFKR